MQKNLQIKLYSDTEDISSISLVINQLKLKEIQILVKRPNKFTLADDEIVLIQVTTISSQYIRELVKIKNDYQNSIIFIIKSDDPVLVSTLVKLGYNAIFVIPFEIPKLISFLTDLVNTENYKSNSSEKGNFDNDYSIDNLVGKSKAFNKIKEMVKKISPKPDVNIMILGDTGTGKGFIARIIHENNPKKNLPFIDLICSAIPDSLMESELFGYEPGAFTQAESRKYGLLELAENGTLFLDELGDISLNIQAKMLRAIEKKEIRRLGGVKDIPIHARFISATNKNLEEMIEAKTFRRDLFHRLNVITINLPTLIEREGDTILLAEYYIDYFNKQFDKTIDGFSNEVMQFLTNYSWPGNIRELRNSIERAVLLEETKTLNIEHFKILEKSSSQQNIINTQLSSNLPQFIRLELEYQNVDLKSISILYAKEVLNKTKGNKSKAAQLLGISRPKLNVLLENQLA